MSSEPATLGGKKGKLFPLGRGLCETSIKRDIEQVGGVRRGKVEENPEISSPIIQETKKRMYWEGGNRAGRTVALRGL